MTTDQRLLAVTGSIRTLFGAAACSCALVDEGGTELRFVAAHGAGAATIVGVRIPVGRGIVGWAAMSGQALSISEVANDPRFAREIAEATDYVPSTIMAAPLTNAAGDVLGVLEVLDPEVDAASDWALAVLGTFASFVAAILPDSSDSPVPESIRAKADLADQILAATADYAKRS